MKKINEFIKFDYAKFFADKKLVFKNGKLTDNKDKFEGAKVELLIEVDNTKYSDEETTNVYENFKVKCVGMTASELKQYKPGMPVNLQIENAKPYLNTNGPVTTIAVSFTGKITPRKN